MGDEDTPYEVGLGFAVSMKKGAFLARDALQSSESILGQQRLIGRWELR